MRSMTSKANRREHYGAILCFGELQRSRGAGGLRIRALTKPIRRGPVKPPFIWIAITFGRR